MLHRRRAPPDRPGRGQRGITGSAHGGNIPPIRTIHSIACPSSADTSASLPPPPDGFPPRESGKTAETGSFRRLFRAAAGGHRRRPWSRPMSSSGSRAESADAIHDTHQQMPGGDSRMLAGRTRPPPSRHLGHRKSARPFPAVGDAHPAPQLAIPREARSRVLVSARPPSPPQRDRRWIPDTASSHPLRVTDGVTALPALPDISDRDSHTCESD